MRGREGCCADWPKPCSYHEGWADAADRIDELKRLGMAMVNAETGTAYAAAEAAFVDSVTGGQR